jgi:hypothetical protein
MNQQTNYAVAFQTYLELSQWQSNNPAVAIVVGGDRLKNFFQRNHLPLEMMLEKRQKLFDTFVLRGANGQFELEEKDGKQQFKMIEEIRRTEFENAMKEWGEKPIQLTL